MILLILYVIKNSCNNQANQYVEGMTRASPSFKKIKGADSLTRFFAERGVPQYMATSTPRALIGAKIAPHSVYNQTNNNG